VRVTELLHLRQPAVATASGSNKLGRRIHKLALRLLEMLLFFRALLFVGFRYSCPCCGWRLRAFTGGGASLTTRDLGYCPRCNSKARHRRIWLFLEQRTNLFSDPLRLFEVSPKYSFARRWVKMRNLRFVGGDLLDRPYIRLRMDLLATPLRSNIFDAVICVHVLEEIHDDRKAMQELFRVTKPGGWALVSVPTQMDHKTYEDPRITAPKERRRAFGEDAHVRIYGYDLVDRLDACGFDVQVDLASDIDPANKRKYGLRDDENIFLCRKP
jgi:SAM-dependent methyltransferase